MWSYYHASTHTHTHTHQKNKHKALTPNPTFTHTHTRTHAHTASLCQFPPPPLSPSLHPVVSQQCGPPLLRSTVLCDRISIACFHTPFRGERGGYGQTCSKVVSLATEGWVRGLPWRLGCRGQVVGEGSVGLTSAFGRRLLDKGGRGGGGRDRTSNIGSVNNEGVECVCVAICMCLCVCMCLCASQ